MSEHPAPAETPIVTRPRPRYSTRTILTAVALGAAVGVILIPLNFAQAALTTTAPLVAVTVYGVWGMSALIPLALLRRPGVGVIGGVAAGIVTIFSQWGIFMVIAMLVWGILMELPFLVTRYRLWGWKTFAVSGLVTGAIACAMSVGSLNMASMAANLVVGICVIQIVSFVTCSLLSSAIARGLERAGISGGRRERADG